jgi:hypothetical protein
MRIFLVYIIWPFLLSNIVLMYIFRNYVPVIWILFFCGNQAFNIVSIMITFTISKRRTCNVATSAKDFLLNVRKNTRLSNNKVESITQYSQSTHDMFFSETESVQTQTVHGIK